MTDDKLIWCESRKLHKLQVFLLRRTDFERDR